MKPAKISLVFEFEFESKAKTLTLETPLLMHSPSYVALALEVLAERIKKENVDMQLVSISS